MPAISASSALSRFRVLDFSRVRAGPTCARMLADFGADVIRIEPPAGVDPNDAMFAAKRQGGDFQNLNRNKRGLTLNLKHEKGIEVLHRLVATADVVLENWRPDVKAPFFSKPEFTATYHAFDDEKTGAYLAHEIDLQATAAITANLTGLVKLADFTRQGAVPVGTATPPPSRTKVWVGFEFKL